MTRPIPAYRPAAETPARYRILYGGAGSGKSVFAAQDALHRCRRDGRERVLVLRKVATTLRGSTFALLRDLVTALRWRDVVVNKSEMSFRFPNGAEILHAGLDDVEKLKSIAGVTRIWVEEATELDFPLDGASEPDLAQIDLRLRGIPAGMVGQITLTFNPTQSARRIFEYLGVALADLPSRSHRTYDGGRVFVQHTTYADNPHAGEDYVTVFRRLGGVMQTVYERGELANIDAPDQLIPYEWVKAAFERSREEAAYDGRQRLAVDVARFGDDETVIGRSEGMALVEIEAAHGQDVVQTAHRALSVARRHGIPAELVAVDTVGLGAGTADRMREEGFGVTEIVAGSSPIDGIPEFSEEAPAFNNLRSQMWWLLRTKMERGEVAVCIDDPVARRKLQEDLLAPRYRYGQEKRIEVEPKDSASRTWGIKPRLGRSPDYGDTLAMLVFVDKIAATNWFWA